MNEEDRAVAAEAAAEATDPFLDALHGYRDDQGSVLDVVAVVRAYRGKRRHLLWDRDRRRRISRRYIRRPYIYDCFDLLSEANMAELIHALIEECPRFPTIRSKRDDGGFRMTFLYVALSLAQQKAEGVAGYSPHDGSTSVQVLKLLAAPNTARLRGGDCDDDDYYRFMPLHQAVRVPCVSPEFVRHLVDLDPDVLSIPDDDKGIPLTRAVDEALWRRSPASVTTILGTLVRRRPSTLLYRPRDMSTPLVVTAIERAPVVTTPEEEDPTTTSTASAAVVDLLVEMVGLCPESLRPPMHGRDALRAATTKFPDHPRLIRAIVEASSPVALCLATSNDDGSGRHVLPVEAVHARRNADANAVKYLHEETTHLALASIEYVLSSRAHDVTFRHPPVATFRRAVFKAVLSALAAAKRIPQRLKSDKDDDIDDSATTQLLPWTGYVLAQQLRGLEHGPAVAWSVFTNSETASALAGNHHHHGRRNRIDNTTDPTAFLNAVLGEPVLKLYHLNRSDRSNPSSGHQLRLLASVGDCLDVIYLHFREVSAHLVAPSSSSKSKSSDVSLSAEDDDHPMEI
jgi:hypothetical protein